MLDASGGQDVQAQVERWTRVGEGADATKWTPVPSRPWPPEPQAAAGLQPGDGTGRPEPRRTQVGQAHVVQEDELGAGSEPRDLGQAVAFHLERHVGCGGRGRRRSPG